MQVIGQGLQVSIYSIRF